MQLFFCLLMAESITRVTDGISAPSCITHQLVALLYSTYSSQLTAASMEYGVWSAAVENDGRLKTTLQSL